MEAALRRRNYALDAHGGRRLHHRGRGRRGAARSRSCCGASRRRQPSLAPYFLEEVRKELEARYGAKQLYENGLSIQTALDSRCRKRPTARWTTGCAGSTSGAASASRAATSSPKDTPSTTFQHARWDRPMRDGDIVPAVVRTADAAAIEARAGALQVTIDRKGFAWTAKTRQSAGEAGRSDRSAARRRRRRPRTTATGTLEQPPLVEGRVPRDRQPHRPDQGDGRRLQLRAQQVQSRHAGAPAGRLGVQADRLHRGDRSRLHAGVADPRTRRPASPAGAGPAALLAAELRPQVRRADHAAPRARAVAQRAGGPGDGSARAAAGHRLRAAARPRVAAAALPAGRARRRRGDAARDDQRATRSSRTRASACSRTRS